MSADTRLDGLAAEHVEYDYHRYAAPVIVDPKPPCKDTQPNYRKDTKRAMFA